MTRKELKDAVRTHFENTTVKNELIEQGLSFGLKTFAQEHDFSIRALTRTGVALTANVETFILSSSEEIQRVKEVRVLDGTSAYSVQIKEKSWFVKKFPNPTESSPSKPLYCYQEANTLYFAPVPDSDYDIEYTYIPDESSFTEDSSENPIPLLDHALVCWATAYLFDSMQKFQEGRLWRSNSYAAFASAVKRDKRTYTRRIAAGSRPAGQDAIDMNEQRLVFPFRFVGR